MNPDIVEELVSGLREIMQDSLEQIILYGSVARGTATEESDVDIALLVKREMDYDLEWQLSDFVVDMELKYDKVFSVIDINAERFFIWREALPFYRNISTEGIVLWKAQ